MSITDKRLTATHEQAIRARLAAATEGPWFVEYESEECPPFKPYAHAIHGPTMRGVLESEVSDDFKARYGHRMDEVGGVADADAEFIAHAREDIPALLAEVERLHDELAKTQEVTAEKVEKAARALHADTCCNGDATGCQYPEDMTTEIWAAQVVMGTVQGGGDDE